MYLYIYLRVIIVVFLHMDKLVQVKPTPFWEIHKILLMISIPNLEEYYQDYSQIYSHGVHFIHIGFGLNVPIFKSIINKLLIW
jgi:hypothetical protein